MVLSSRRARIGAVLAALALLATAAPALAQGYDARNADMVDGKHATSYTTTASRRRNKLIAANRAGVLPNNIIKMAPNSSRLGGRTLAQVLASADDVYTAGAGLGLEAGQFSLLGPFRLPQDCTADQVVQFDSPGWGCLSLPQGTTYTAGDGLDLIGLTEFVLEPGGVTANHLGSSSVDTDELAGSAVTEGKLAFNPATQDELDALGVAGTLNDAGNPVDWTKLKTVPLGFADGTDANTTYSAATGLILSGTTFSVNTSVIQNRVFGSCAAGTSIRAIFGDGSVACEADDNTTYTAGAGLGLSGTTFSVSFAGTGTANTVAHSDHNHDATYALEAHDHDFSYWKLGGNAFTNGGAEFIGTTDNQILQFKVNNGKALRLEPHPVSPNIVGGGTANLTFSGVFGASIFGGGGAAGNRNLVSDAFGTVSGGSGNHAGDGLGTTNDRLGATIGGGQSNNASATESTVAGGFDNDAVGTRSTISGGGSNLGAAAYSAIGGGQSNSAGGTWATIGGGMQNQATISGATIAGGQSNSVSGNNGAIGGGFSNDGSGASSFIGGGSDNAAGGGSSVVGGGTGNVVGGFGSQTFIGGGNLNSATGSLATIGGGNSNDATNTYAFVGGGSGNTASGFLGTVAGGDTNTASGGQSTVPGGALNTAGGDWSFAAGRRAKANHAGTFVWGDSNFADVVSTDINQFVARASGGVTFYSNGAMTTGVSLAANDGTWASLSDANMKQDFAAVDGRATLDALASVPIGTWRYLGQDDSVLHMGPTAQDFRAAFGLGSDDRHITTIDADGVALSAIQGLYELVQDQQAQIERLERLALRRGGMNRVR